MRHDCMPTKESCGDSLTEEMPDVAEEGSFERRGAETTTKDRPSPADARKGWSGASYEGRLLTMTAENGAMYHVPTLRERAARRLGYRYHLGQEPDGIDALDWWQCTEARMHFGVADRLRLLFSGRLHIKLVQHMNVQVETTKNRFDWQILAPGDR